jgi:RNA polymerase sigma-70 factor, ECF subfamily
MGLAAACTAGFGRTGDRPSPTSAPNGHRRTGVSIQGASSAPGAGDDATRVQPAPSVQANGSCPSFSGDEASPRGNVSDELEQLYQSTYTAVVRFLYRKVWDAERAEDLAQEVFVRALAHRPEKPRAWVFAVAANLARDEARAAVRRKRHLTLLKGDPIAQPAMELSADDAVEHDEQMAAVQEALDSLTPRDREILLLWDAGLSYPEIAAQTGLAVGAVGTTLARARRRLVEAHDRRHTRTGTDAAHS